MLSGPDFERVASQVTQALGQPVRCTGTACFPPMLAAGRFGLANGLTIVLLPDARAPVFAFQTWFRVGSGDEAPDRTGLAHLFEHLMFKGTRRHPKGALDREMEKRGSQTNAATWVDWTFYTETLAAQGDNLATVVDFEVDRMTQLVLDEETFATEREVVKNERRMVVDDSVNGELSERLHALAFTRHPYGHPTIGQMAHLERVRLAEVEQFYRAYYTPNNAIVVVAGAIDLVPTLTLLARAYGRLSAQPVPQRVRRAEPAQCAPRVEQLERSVTVPQVVLGFPGLAQNDPDFAALEMLSEILVAGDNGRLYQQLVARAELAADVAGFLAPCVDPGLYEIWVTGRPGVDPALLIDGVQAELDHLVAGFSRDELAKARNNLALAQIAGLKDAEGCAEALGHFEANFGEFGRAFGAVDRWRAISTEQLRALAARVFSSARRSAVMVTPVGAEP